MAGIRKYPYQQVDVDENKTVENLGNNIYRLRMEKGLSIRLLALQAGVEESTMKRIEKGLSNAGIVSIVRIAQALNVSIDALIKGENIE